MKQNFQDRTYCFTRHNNLTNEDVEVTGYTLHAIVSFDKQQTRLLFPNVIGRATDTYKELETTRDMEGNRILTIHISRIAKCDPKDKFDGETGERIAQSRAYIRYYHIMNMIFKNIISYYKKLGLQPIDDNCWVAKTATGFQLKYNNECLHLNDILETF